jgi:hypothetical protein
MSTEQEVIALVAKRTGRPESSITPGTDQDRRN